MASSVRPAEQSRIAAVAQKHSHRLTPTAASVLARLMRFNPEPQPLDRLDGMRSFSRKRFHARLDVLRFADADGNGPLG